MSPGGARPERRCRALLAAAAGVAAAALTLIWAAAPPAVVASAVGDPFLERFRVGSGLEDSALTPGALAPHGGYPAGLLEPCRLDTAWAEAAATYFAGPLPPQGPGLLAWRVLRPALGTSEAAQDWFALRRDRALGLLALATPGGEALSAPADTAAGAPLYLLAETLSLEATRRWQNSDYAGAAACARRLLARAGELELPAEARLVWRLRLSRLRELAGQPRSGALWPELWDLGPFDREGGWALWRAHRRALGASVLPPGTDPEELVALLRRLRAHGLRAPELAAAGLDPAAADLLGAASLEGEELRRALMAWAVPPREPELQPIWIGAQRRLQDGAEALEALAARGGLAAGERAELWRQAADRRLIAGEWAPALIALERAVALAESASAARRGRVGDQLLQAAALATVRDRAAERERVLALVDRLEPETGSRVRRDLAEFGLAPAASRDPAGGGPQADLADAARLRVRRGEAPELAAAGGTDLAPAMAAARETLWEIWLRWGSGLLATRMPSGPQAALWGGHAAGLEAAAAAASSPARFALSCAAAGRALRGSDLVDPVGDWLLERDLAEGRPDLPPAPSPLPALAHRLPGGDRLLRHALLGVSLAAGDGRGQIALALGLPWSGILEPPQRLRFLYPVPGPLAPHLARGGVEAPLVLAIVRNESLFEPGARSRAGALGLLQVMPFHYPERGAPAGRPIWRLPRVSLGAGARILAADAARFGGDPYRTVASYNAGPGAVGRWDRQLGGRAVRRLFLAWIGYPETRAYTEKVLIDRALYAWILASPGS